MAKLTDMQIRAWIKAGERFEGRSDGNELYLRYRAVDRSPIWRFRYKFSGKMRAMVMGSYSDLSLAKARETAKKLSARVALGYDVAGEKQERKTQALEKIEQDKNALRVSELAAEYFKRQIMGRWKHPDILRRRIDKDINPSIGHRKWRKFVLVILTICYKRLSLVVEYQRLPMMYCAGFVEDLIMVSNGICWKLILPMLLRLLMQADRSRWLTREE